MWQLRRMVTLAHQQETLVGQAGLDEGGAEWFQWGRDGAFVSRNMKRSRLPHSAGFLQETLIHVVGLPHLS